MLCKKYIIVNIGRKKNRAPKGAVQISIKL